MRSVFVFILAALPTLALAGQAGRPKVDKTPDSGKQLPLKRAAGSSPCAAFGPGFTKIEGSDTCMRIGGAVGIGAGVSSGGR
jgi:hypothetical protein